MLPTNTANTAKPSLNALP
ncbi:hypothetical protein D039_0760A, partial [Vibrio parahaemolyticus EKP-028]